MTEATTTLTRAGAVMHSVRVGLINTDNHAWKLEGMLEPVDGSRVEALVVGSEQRTLRWVDDRFLGPDIVCRYGRTTRGDQSHGAYSQASQKHGTSKVCFSTSFSRESQGSRRCFRSDCQARRKANHEELLPTLQSDNAGVQRKNRPAIRYSKASLRERQELAGKGHSGIC